MTRTGHPRAVPVRVSALAAVAMLLFALAASVLVSAGSPHHVQSAATAVTTVHTDADGASPVTGHDHEHGTEWAPTLGKRLRPAAAVAVVGALPAHLDGPGAPFGTTMSPALVAPGDRLISLSVLRV